ncbi:MAG: alpha-galactosidase [Clostridia bacterium]|nr:alpha-galactosidase [Clostridia bacterium]
MDRMACLGHLFSLTYGGEDFFAKAGMTLAEGQTVYFADGLTVKVNKRYYYDDAVYWDVTLVNPDNENSLQIKDIKTVDITLPINDPILTFTKGTWQPNIEHDLLMEKIPLTDSVHLSCACGRSSQQTMPYFSIDAADGKNGLLCALGWSGQWKCDISQDNGNVHICAGVEDTDFYLYPGEELYLGSGIALYYSDNNRAAHNRFRGIMRELSPLGKPGRCEHLPVSLSFWGDTKQDELIDISNYIKNENIDFDVIWIDAGWFHPRDLTPRDAWVAFNGEWEVDPEVCPDGSYGKATKVMHENGHGFLLWYEPERASENSKFAVRHPEAFLHVPLEQDPIYQSFAHIVPDEYKWRLKNGLVNLGCELGYNFMYTILANGIRNHGIDWLRIDFNTYPRQYWELNDIQSRKGIVQIKYINGLYRLLDQLMTEFPHLMIDNCASGGSRLDIEMQKYSLALWRSDCQCGSERAPEVLQSQSMGTAEWFVSCSGAGEKNALEDKYRFRSSYSSGSSITVMNNVGLGDNLADVIKNHRDFTLFKQLMTEFNSVRECYNGDYYPLSTQSPDDHSIWCAWQYEKGTKGVLQAFRRKECKESSYVLNMHFEADKTYKFYNFDTEESFTLKGSELAGGLTVTLDEPYSSLILRYEVI